MATTVRAATAILALVIAAAGLAGAKKKGVSARLCPEGTDGDGGDSIGRR